MGGRELLKKIGSGKGAKKGKKLTNANESVHLFPKIVPFLDIFQNFPCTLEEIFYFLSDPG